MTELTHLSLFSGIGGLDLAAEQAGFTSVGQCEWADYPTKVLEKHWPDVPRWRDIRTLTGDDFYARAGRRSVTVISGGFPCQPFSVAGKQRGKEDDRYLWPEMCRAISEIKPTWVIGENVPGIINLALDTVLSDLESQGYACQTFIIPACAVDAPHQRKRIAIVGWNHDRQPDGWNTRDTLGRTPERPDADTSRNSSRVVADSLRIGSTTGAADSKRGQERIPAKPFDGSSIVDYSDSLGLSGHNRRKQLPQPENRCWWPAEPNVGRVANGVPARVDRLKCLGNAVVPQQFYPFFKYIAEIENRLLP